MIQPLVLRYVPLYRTIKPFELSKGVFIRHYSDTKIKQRIRRVLRWQGIDDKNVFEEYDLKDIRTNSLIVYYDESSFSHNYFVLIYRVGKIMEESGRVPSLHLVLHVEQIPPRDFDTAKG